MLLRAYRVTDKLSIVFLKSLAEIVALTLDGLGILNERIFVPISRLILMVLIGLLNIIIRLTGGTTITMRREAATVMARRAARAQIDAELREDPLLRQNRVLSALTVVLLVILIGAILWATSPARSTQATLPPVDMSSLLTSGANTAGNNTPAPLPATSAPSILATPVPTATPLPSVLEVRGSVAYVVREFGQTDIWAIPVGSRTPLRLTNDPADERDPAWSPDGRRLAYASRADGNWELYIYDVGTGEATRMTYDLSFQGKPNWSPDGDWLVYESYQGNNLDIYILRVDGSQPPIRLPGNSDAPDFSPAWSPDGRRIAFVSWRDGNQDIYVFSLDDQSVINVTNTPRRNEDYPAWQPLPNTNLLTYSALDEGLEKVFVKAVDDPLASAQALYGGRMPAWSPDGASLIFTVDSVDGSQLIAAPFSTSGGVASIIPVPAGASSPSWTAAPLPAALVNSGGLPPGVTDPLYIEQVNERATDPPIPLQPLPGVNVENAALSDRVNDSFNALREATLQQVGWDFLGRLDDAFWRLDRPPEPGEPRRNWHMTGRAFSITRSAIAGFPPPVEIVREDIGVEVLWRVYVRVADDAQSGQLGEPLRRMPWDFASRTQGDVEAYDQGGRLRNAVPGGYYVDFTQLAADYGWERVPAGSDWRANANAINYWLFLKSDGLDWYNAMREIYPEGQLINFAPTAIPVPRTPTAPAASGDSGLPPDAEALLTPQPPEGS